MSSSPSVYILAAPLFDEQSVVTCLSEMRGQGIKTLLVATTPGLLSGKRGITLRPDMTLSQLEESIFIEGQMAIIAGGEESAATLLSDPRTHKLIQNVIASNGFVAGMKQTCQFMEALDYATAHRRDHYLWQSNEDISVFIQRLINVLYLN